MLSPNRLCEPYLRVKSTIQMRVSLQVELNGVMRTECHVNHIFRVLDHLMVGTLRGNETLRQLAGLQTT